MLLSSVAIVVGIALLYAGAEALVRGSASAAAQLGLTPLVIGLTVVAFGTSAPELVVSVGAALADQGVVAVGNVVGSNIGNIGLILGLAVVIRPARVQAQILRFDVPLLLLVTLALVLILGDGRVVRWEGPFSQRGWLPIRYGHCERRAARMPRFKRSSRPASLRPAAPWPATSGASSGDCCCW